MRRALSIGTALVAFAATAAPARATDYPVVNLNDSGAGSFRQAILDANTNSGADQVTFDGALNGTIDLTSGVILITGPLNILGPGSNVIAVDGQGSTQLLSINNVADPGVLIAGLTLRGGSNPDAGGALNNFNSKLQISDCVFDDNHTSKWGGAIESFQGTLSVLASTFTNNSADHEFGGGAIHVGDGGTTASTITATQFSDNEAVNGGAMALLADKNTVSGVTLDGNDASVNGGGLLADRKTSVSLSTFDGNTAGKFGGGLAASGTLSVKSSTVTDNEAKRGGGISKPKSSKGTIVNTIVGLNNASKKADDVNGGKWRVTYSLVQAKKGARLKGGHNIFGKNPKLEGLGDNGGETETRALKSSSPAIDKASAKSPASDQRGYERDPQPDIGAFEFGATP